MNKNYRPTYSLTPTEMWPGVCVGATRRITSIFKHHDKNKHADKSDWATDIDGAHAEQVLAKHLDRYWLPTNLTFKEPDVKDYQVRSTTWHDGHLIIRPNDEDTGRPYVLIETHAPNYIVCGWFTPAEAKIEKYWRKDKNSWWVPQEDLHDIRTMPPPPIRTAEAA